MENKKYYWLKLNKDFFKRHDITILESVENGKEILLLYMKLLCESLDHNGKLRFSKNIPYDEKMLASVTKTDVEIVKQALEIFKELNMISIQKDGTILMKAIDKMTGCETEWAVQKRDYRERKKQEKVDKKQ